MRKFIGKLSVFIVSTVVVLGFFHKVHLHPLMDKPLLIQVGQTLKHLY